MELHREGSAPAAWTASLLLYSKKTTEKKHVLALPRGFDFLLIQTIVFVQVLYWPGRKGCTTYRFFF